MPFPSLVALSVLVVLVGPAGGMLFAGGLSLVGRFFIFLSAASMGLHTSLWFRLIVSASFVVVPVRMMISLTSSWLTMTSVLKIPDIFSRSKSSVSVLRPIRLVVQRPLTLGALPDLASPTFRLVVIEVHQRKT